MEGPGGGGGEQVESRRKERKQTDREPQTSEVPGFLQFQPVL